MLYAIITILTIQTIAIILLFIKIKQISNNDILQKLDKYESNLRDEFARNREETNKSARESRDELSKNMSNFSDIVDNKMKTIRDFLETGLKNNREEQVTSLKSFEDNFTSKITILTKETQESLEKNRMSVERKLSEIQESNEKKLEKMRETVDEKLQKTLEVRLGESFKLVSERLELVQKGLGEMQSLASDVGDLKKVMSNVKTKGILGEYQLESILEQFLSPTQYDKNVATKSGSNDRVEFAIKIPSKEDSDSVIWLPIDAKLPTVDYELLLEAYDKGDKDNIEEARKVFFRTIRTFAKKINEKYIDTPNTTNFAILFLPFEGAYAEVVRDPGFYDSIQKENKIIITGPSTIAAFLNALQIGFKSLAVEKGTAQILSTLSAAKKEFSKYESILVKVKEQIEKASLTLDEAVGRRTRAINRALKNIESSNDDLLVEKLIEDATLEDDDNP